MLVFSYALFLPRDHCPSDQWMQMILWSATSSREVHWHLISHEKNKFMVTDSLPKIYKALKPTLEQISQFCNSDSAFSSSKLVVSLRNCWLRIWVRNTLCLSLPVWPIWLSCVGALPQEIGHWLGFWNQNLQLSLGIAFRSDSQMTCRPNLAHAGAWL